MFVLFTTVFDMNVFFSITGTTIFGRFTPNLINPLIGFICLPKKENLSEIVSPSSVLNSLIKTINPTTL